MFGTPLGVRQLINVKDDITGIDNGIHDIELLMQFQA